VLSRCLSAVVWGVVFAFFVCLFATAYAPSSLGLCLHGASRQDPKIQFIRDGGEDRLGLVDGWKVTVWRIGKRCFWQGNQRVKSSYFELNDDHLAFFDYSQELSQDLPNTLHSQGA
jgi:hypothetical protein